MTAYFQVDLRKEPIKEGFYKTFKLDRFCMCVMSINANCKHSNPKNQEQKKTQKKNHEKEL